MKVEAGDRAFETARKIHSYIFKLQGFDHADIHECHCCDELADEIQSAMDAQERELRAKIKPSYAELHQLLLDTLDNLRLMRQLDSLDKSLQSRVVADGYELFDRWQAINGFTALGSEFDDDEAGRESHRE